MQRRKDESMTEFKIRRAAHNKWLRDRLKGRFAHVSKGPHDPRGTGTTYRRPKD